MKFTKSKFTLMRSALRHRHFSSRMRNLGSAFVVAMSEPLIGDLHLEISRKVCC